MADVPDEDSALSLPAKERIDRVCLAFEDAWRSGDRPRLEYFVSGAVEPERSALLRELLLLEFEYRRRLQEIPLEAEYLSRFPGDSRVVAEGFKKSAGGPRNGAETASLTSEGSLSAPPTAAPDAAYSPGDMLGRYTVRKVLGKGGFGTVYLAWDELLRRPVAIKVPRREQFSTSEQENGFFEEARTTARLKHPSIVPVHDVGRHTDGTPYVVMDYVDGKSLEEVLKSGRLSYAQLASLMIDVAEAVAYAHGCGIVHRDLKPGNILLEAGGKPLITDFGLAEQWELRGGARHPARLAGTLYFIAPEVLEGSGPVGPPTDVYALGVTLYKALAGRHPFEGQSPGDVEQQVRTAAPPLPKELRPDVPEALQRICLKAMEKVPHDRYESVHALAEDLRRYVEGREVLARPKRYDAELQGRLENHYVEIRAWQEQGLISIAEMDRLMRPYWFLMQADEPPRPLPRLRSWETVSIRMGGWFVLLGSLLWAAFYWPKIHSHAERVLAILLPTLGINGVGWIFQYAKSRPNTRIFLGIGALLVPLLVAVVLCECDWLAACQADHLELFLATGPPHPFITPTNLQLTLAAAALVAYSLLLLRVCRNRIFAIWLGIGIYAAFTGILLRCGLRPWLLNDDRAWAIAWYVGLCFAVCLASLFWAFRFDKREAAWLFIFFPVPLAVFMTLLVWHGSSEWLADYAPLGENQTMGVWWMLNGAIYWTAAALCFRSRAGFIRFWGSFFLFLVPLSLLVPANLLFRQGARVLELVGSQPVHVYELLCLVFSVGLVITGTKVSQASLTFPGLVGLGVVVFRMTHYHFTEYLSWPLALTLGGSAAMLAAAVSWSVRWRLRRQEAARRPRT